MGLPFKWSVAKDIANTRAWKKLKKKKTPETNAYVSQLLADSRKQSTGFPTKKKKSQVASLVEESRGQQVDRDR